MALQEAIKQFYFGDGIETRVDQAALPLGKLHLLQNARINKGGVIQKKYGSSAITILDSVLVPTGDGYTPSVLPDIKRLTTLGETLIAIGPNDYSTSSKVPCHDLIFKDSPGTNRWVASSERSGAESCIARTYPVGNSSRVFPTGMFASDIATNSRYLCVATFNNDGTNKTILATIIDTEIDRAIFSTTATLTNGGLHPRVITFNNKFYVFGQESGLNNIKALEIDPTTLAFTTVTIATDAFYADDEQILFDVGVNGSSAYIVYRNNAGSTTLKQFSSLNPVTVTNTQTTATLPARHVSIFFSGSMVCVAFCRAADLYLGSWSSTLTAVTAPFNAYNAQTENAYGSDLVIGGVNLVVLSEGTTSTTRNIRSATWDPTTGALTGTFASVGLGGCYQAASRPFNYNSRWHLFINYRNDNDQDTVFLVQHERNNSAGPAGFVPIAKAFYGETRPTPNFSAGTLPTMILPSVVMVNSSNTKFAAPFVRVEGEFGDGVYTTTHSNHVFEVQFSDIRNYYDREAQGDLLFVGGIVGQYDGYEWTENSFLTAPEPPSLSQSAGGSLTALGTYQYVLTYEWTDAAGMLHRSAPSIPTSITLTGGNQTVSITNIASLLTRKQNVTVRIFRTEASGTLFYSITAFTNTTGLLIADTTADSSIIDNELLYTTGGVLENNSMYLVSGMTIFKDRVFLLTDRGLYYSKRFSLGRPVEFSELFQFAIEDSGGKPTAIATLGDKLLIFKKDKIYFLAGDGPEDTGAGALFSNPELVTSECGCISQTSIAELGGSVLFQARDFIWEIDSGFNLSPIGSPVSYFLGETAVINKTIVLEREREVKFQMDSRILNYNIFMKQWSVDTTYGGPSMALWRSNLIRSDSSFNVFQETQGASSSWKDGNNFVELRAATGWINLDLILGFERVWEAFLLLRFYNNHTLNVDVFYDYLPKVVDSYQFTALNSNLAAFTDAHVFTSTHFTTSGVTPYMFRMHLKNQKCKAIKFEIYDSNQSGDGHALDIVGLALRMGLKGYSAKLPAAQSI